MKQLESDPFGEYVKNLIGRGRYRIVSEVEPKLVTVKLAEEVFGHMKASEIAKDRTDDATQLYKVGESIEVKIVKVDRASRAIALSVRALTEDAHKAVAKAQEAIPQAKLGDLLQAQMDKADKNDEG